jgi:hypothetical protein
MGCAGSQVSARLDWGRGRVSVLKSKVFDNIVDVGLLAIEGRSFSSRGHG